MTRMTFSSIDYTASTRKAMPVDQDHVVFIQEHMGLRVVEGGKGPFNNMATHIALAMYLDKGVYHYHGYETDADKDDDKIVWELWDIPSDDSSKGKGKIIWATGKFAGIEGTVDFVVDSPKGFPESTSRHISQEVMKLTLKNPL